MLLASRQKYSAHTGICFLKKMPKRSILCMYPMNQWCLDELVTDCFTQRGNHHVLPFDFVAGCDGFIGSLRIHSPLCRRTRARGDGCNTSTGGRSKNHAGGF